MLSDLLFHFLLAWFPVVCRKHSFPWFRLWVALSQYSDPWIHLCGFAPGLALWTSFLKSTEIHSPSSEPCTCSSHQLLTGSSCSLHHPCCTAPVENRGSVLHYLKVRGSATENLGLEVSREDNCISEYRYKEIAVLCNFVQLDITHYIKKQDLMLL